MAKFRKKPVVIEAMQLVDVASAYAILAWNVGKGNIGITRGDGPVHLKILTLEGEMRADLGDWIIRGVKGEVYPCKPDIFAATYEPT